MIEIPESSKTNALSVALIMPDAKRRRAMAVAISASHLKTTREFDLYPAPGGPNEVSRMGCDVAIVDLDGDVERAISVIEGLCILNSSMTVMACSAKNDSTLMRRSMQAGAREFLVEPLLTETVTDALTRASARRVHQETPLGKVLVFVPTKGGVGVTTLAANFAMALTRESGARVVVVDMDFQLGEIALGLGMVATFSIADALGNAERLDRDFLSTLLLRHRSGLAVLGSPEKYNFFHFSGQQGATTLFRILREEFDYVVVDSGTCHGEMQEAIFEMADKLYLITEFTLPALRNAHRLISYLATGDGSPRLEVVVNRFNSRNGDIDENSAAKAMGKPVNWRIPNGYAAARAAQDNGVPLALENSPITKVLVQMAKAACGKALDVPKKASAGFSFFGSKTLSQTVET